MLVFSRYNFWLIKCSKLLEELDTRVVHNWVVKLTETRVPTSVPISAHLVEMGTRVEPNCTTKLTETHVPISAHHTELGTGLLQNYVLKLTETSVTFLRALQNRYTRVDQKCVVKLPQLGYYHEYVHLDMGIWFGLDNSWMQNFR